MRTRGFEPRTSSLSATRSNQLSYVREANFRQPPPHQKWTGKCIARFSAVNGKFARSYSPYHGPPYIGPSPRHSEPKHLGIPFCRPYKDRATGVR
jgi:hypothetical protein